MKPKKIMPGDVRRFENFLQEGEKSPVTICKYLHDLRDFAAFAAGRAVGRELVLDYKRMLTGRYAARSVNSKLSSLGSFFRFMGWEECRVKAVKVQREAYVSEEKELTRQEYFRLLSAAQKNVRLHLILQTICATGIRVSELSYFTVESVRTGTVTVRCKGKTRNIFVPGKLKRKLLNYAKQQGIAGGIVFRTRTGKPVNRSNIWAEMKKLCVSAQVNPKKVFPHNLRKLFARAFYAQERDIAKLADILGHSSIDTTRIYIMTTGAEHRKKIEHLGLVV